LKEVVLYKHPNLKQSPIFLIFFKHLLYKEGLYFLGLLFLLLQLLRIVLQEFWKIKKNNLRNSVLIKLKIMVQVLGILLILNLTKIRKNNRK